MNTPNLFFDPLKGVLLYAEEAYNQEIYSSLYRCVNGFSKNSPPISAGNCPTCAASASSTQAPRSGARQNPAQALQPPYRTDLYSLDAPLHQDFPRETPAFRPGRDSGRRGSPPCGDCLSAVPLWSIHRDLIRITDCFIFCKCPIEPIAIASIQRQGKRQAALRN